MARELIVNTPMGELKVITHDEPEYPEVYVEIDGQQLVRIGYNGDGMYEDMTAEKENIVVDVWNDGGYNDPRWSMAFGKSTVESWKE